MLKHLRTFIPLLAIFLVSLFMIDAATCLEGEVCVWEQVELQSVLTCDAGDLDDNDNEECLVPIINTNRLSSLTIPCHWSLGRAQNENRCSAKLRLGQVRRYAPKKNIASVYSNIIESYDGVNFRSCHLFCLFQIFILNFINHEKTVLIAYALDLQSTI